jgi:hypothetical protein
MLLEKTGFYRGKTLYFRSHVAQFPSGHQKKAFCVILLVLSGLCAGKMASLTLQKK